VLLDSTSEAPSRWPWRSARWPRATFAVWGVAVGICLVVALGAGTLGLRPRAPVSPLSAGPAQAQPNEVIAAQETVQTAGQGPGLIEGQWEYGKYGLYHISRDDQGRWSFRERTTWGAEVSGGLHPVGSWLEASLTTADGHPTGRIRLRRGPERTLISNYAAPDELGRPVNWSQSEDVVAHYTTDDHYVLLEVFRLRYTRLIFGGFYHSQMAICPKSHFSAEERRVLDGLQLDPSKGFAEVPPTLWRRSPASCFKLSFGGIADNSRCSGISAVRQALRLDSALIPNVEPGVAWKYLYGDGPFSGPQTARRICMTSCGDQWSGGKYNLVTRNCNTFTSTVLQCVYGLSQEKPGLGVSDLWRVGCSC